MYYVTHLDCANIQTRPRQELSSVARDHTIPGHLIDRVAYTLGELTSTFLFFEISSSKTNNIVDSLNKYMSSEI
jgi:hypothetical protein